MRWSLRLVAGLVGLVLFTIAFINLVVAALILDLLEVWAWVALVLGMVLVAVPAIRILGRMTSPSAQALERQYADLRDQREELTREVHRLELRLEEMEKEERQKREELTLAREEVENLFQKREELIREVEGLNFRVAERQVPENPLDSPSSELDIPGFLQRPQRD